MNTVDVVTESSHFAQFVFPKTKQSQDTGTCTQQLTSQRENIQQVLLSNSRAQCHRFDQQTDRSMKVRERAIALHTCRRTAPVPRLCIVSHMLLHTEWPVLSYYWTAVCFVQQSQLCCSVTVPRAAPRRMSARPWTVSPRHSRCVTSRSASHCSSLRLLLHPQGCLCVCARNWAASRSLIGILSPRTTHTRRLDWRHLIICHIISLFIRLFSSLLYSRLVQQKAESLYHTDTGRIVSGGTVVTVWHCWYRVSDGFSAIESSQVERIVYGNGAGRDKGSLHTGALTRTGTHYLASSSASDQHCSSV